MNPKVTLAYCIVDKTRNRWSACVILIILNDDNLYVASSRWVTIYPNMSFLIQSCDFRWFSLILNHLRSDFGHLLAIQFRVLTWSSIFFLQFLQQLWNCKSPLLGLPVCLSLSLSVSVCVCVIYSYRLLLVTTEVIFCLFHTMTAHEFKRSFVDKFNGLSLKLINCGYREQHYLVIAQERLPNNKPIHLLNTIIFNKRYGGWVQLNLFHFHHY